MLASLHSAVSALDSGLRRIVAASGSTPEAPKDDATAESSPHTILEAVTLVASTEEPTKLPETPTLKAAEAAGAVTLTAEGDANRVSVELTPIGEYLAASEEQSNPTASGRRARARR